MHCRSSRALLCALLLATVTLTACTTTVTGAAAPGPAAAAPAGATADLRYQNGFREFVGTLATMRTWDPCAMHDIAAAETATGGKRQYIVPPSTISKCSLTLTHAGSEHSWDLAVDMTFVANLARLYESGNLDGTKILRERPPEPGTPTFGTSCSYFYPVQEPLGIKVTAQTTDKDTRDAVCGIADKYVTAVLPNLKNPPLVAAGRTSPTITGYGKDPCAALRPAADARTQDRAGQPTYLSGLNPYTCQLRSDNVLEDKTSVEFTTIFDEGGKTAQLGSLKAFVKDSYGDCEYRTPIDPPIKFKVDDPNWPGYEPGMIIKIEGGCNDALATSIVQAAMRQPGPVKSGGGPTVITLGKLA